MYRCTGNIHIHSDLSDGHASIPAIARAAAAAGLDFIILTDHHTLAGMAFEGYHHGVLVLAGAEVNKDSHHLLALNITQEIAPDDQDPKRVIDAVASQGGLSFIAHPFEKGSPLVLGGRHFPWSRWEAEGFTGIEVWNLSSQWRDAVKSVFHALYFGFVNPYAPIKGPCPEAMSRFDQVTQKRQAVAIAGSDNHAWPVRWGPLRRAVFPYPFAFRNINNCLLLDQPLAKDLPLAKKQVYGALARGRSFIVNSRLGDPAGFSFTAENDSGQYHMGDTVPLQGPTCLSIRCPDRSWGRLRHRIVNNGRLLDEIPRCNVTLRVHEPGAYRLEVYQNNKPWLFTNPIYIV